MHYALWESSQEVVRGRTQARLIRAAVAWLDLWAVGRPSGLMGLRCLAAIDRDGQAVLLPADLRSVLHPIEARLRRIGLRPIDSPIVDLDPDSAELVVGHSAVALGGDLPPADEGVPSGRYPVTDVVVPSGRDADLRAIDAIGHLARWATAGLPPETRLRTLVLLGDQTRRHRLAAGSPDDVIAAMGRVLTG